MEYEISNRLSGVHGSMIRELFKLEIGRASCRERV